MNMKKSEITLFTCIKPYFVLLQYYEPVEQGKYTNTGQYKVMEKKLNWKERFTEFNYVNL